MHSSSSPGLARLHHLRVRAALLLRLLPSPQPAPARARTSRSRLPPVLAAPRPRMPVPFSAAVLLPHPVVPRTVSSLRSAAPSEPAAAVLCRRSSACGRLGASGPAPVSPRSAASRSMLRPAAALHLHAHWPAPPLPRCVAAASRPPAGAPPVARRVQPPSPPSRHASAAALASARGQAGCVPQAAPGSSLRPPLPCADAAWGLIARARLPEPLAHPRLPLRCLAPASACPRAPRVGFRTACADCPDASLRPRLHAPAPGRLPIASTGSGPAAPAAPGWRAPARCLGRV
nr:vegetative cell wall protein gp1-like [Aegilops tauschii subsp. strangulata]